MVNSILTPSATEAARIELKSYNTAIPMGSLAIGVDNIHHDVFLSPRFVQVARGIAADFAICCCDRPRASRIALMLSAR